MLGFERKGFGRHCLAQGMHNYAVRFQQDEGAGASCEDKIL